MTYCLAASLKAGLVFAADTRTNAGLDHVNSFRKMHSLVWEGDRVLVLLSAGNLATTQAVVTHLQREAESGGPLSEVRHLSDAADHVGQVSLQVQRKYRAAEDMSAVSLEATFILGGQIGDEPTGAFLIYPQGNFITCSEEQPFLQIGETKYGKPILDRIIEPGLSLEDAARCALVSIDSTMRSNLSVGPPVDLAIYPAGALQRPRMLRYKHNSPYFASVRKHWGEGLRRLFDDLPRFDWEG
ncbi:proteasome-type protease [Alkalilimnicola ehrlichii MLHE-1]|uniref:20S proteasome, A and B subunits n=1 Tax=Alkalilimnicola ehrlichii (strain ATCC BAA-1101 / DSM 17681 / MLHE-1) TaxID=187272 RepID=Q0AAL1_ALKEH|nr:proteasome-type protease [Alkalilimnicola ehrlichii]ABI56126.1 20S proteasome, A and B subunits [Alkalilimnicola ehrlichii MLHE-1]